MEKHKDLGKNETVFVGIDLHKRTWHVTIRTFDIELFSGSIPGLWKNLEPLLRVSSENHLKMS
jgi:hypothetical protein